MEFWKSKNVVKYSLAKLGYCPSRCSKAFNQWPLYNAGFIEYMCLETGVKVEETHSIIPNDLLGEILPFVLPAGFEVLISGEEMGISIRGRSNGFTK